MNNNPLTNVIMLFETNRFIPACLKKSSLGLCIEKFSLKEQLSQNVSFEEVFMKFMSEALISNVKMLEIRLNPHSIKHKTMTIEYILMVSNRFMIEY